MTNVAQVIDKTEVTKSMAHDRIWIKVFVGTGPKNKRSYSRLGVTRNGSGITQKTYDQHAEQLKSITDRLINMVTNWKDPVTGTQFENYQELFDFVEKEYNS